MERYSIDTKTKLELLADQLFDQYAAARINGIKPIEDVRFKAIAAAEYIAAERGDSTWTEVLDEAMVDRQTPINLRERYKPKTLRKLFKIATYHTGLLTSNTRSPEDDLKALLT